MDIDFTLTAERRDEFGKNASRRLRNAGKVPAIIYGGGESPVAVTFERDSLLHHLEHEAFCSHVLTVHVDGSSQKVILRELQRHPYKPSILHMDLLRIREDTAINVHVPLHFINEDACHGVKLEGGVISHNLSEIEISCLPKDLPEFIEIDVQGLGLNQAIYLSDIDVPQGVTITELIHGEEHDHPVVSVHAKRVATEETQEVHTETDDEFSEDESVQ